MKAHAKDDRELQQDVQDELDFEPSIDSAGIGVSVDRGVVTLTGHVASYAQKLDAEKAAWRVEGVKAVVQKMDVHYSFDPPTDEDLARQAVSRLRWDSTIPDGVHVKVSNAVVTLEGEVNWQYQRANAERALRFMRGLKGIVNVITLKPAAQPLQVKERILDALQRNAAVEAAAIRVEVKDGHTVTLEGNVDNWSERWAVEHAAWSAPGVTRVVDRLAIV